ncbi:hypothetical protein K435DRAFT_772585 [Dendrothele bispora CBS 962.96]|uniref:Uncharacterized protein n=1 Tax=Dendrothele bispora (strain CBS 962.96) TaxID=1314807 RepID=A0A4S8MVA1_DENBC|nr:hypothetical protein K435DRAFT_772585 [Dendrothele bispora CBS 962.96]
MGATPPAENHIMGREDSSAQRLDLLDDNAFQSNIESRDETKTEVGVELPVPLPPPLPVPGIWGFKIGLPKPDLLVFDFVVNEEIAIKWGLNSRSGDDNNAILGSGKPRLVLHLLCLPAWEMLQAKLDEWQKTVVTEPTLEARAHFIWTLQTPWPPQGSLIIEANKGKNCGKTILPQHLIGISALDITSNVQVGDNTFQLIQLTPMPHCFALHASMTEPQLDMACFSQFVEMQTNQAGPSSIIASTTVEVHPSIL